MELNVGQKLALAIDMHLILDAGAGTGKTQSIVGRTIEHYLSIDQRATRLLPPGPRPKPLASGALKIGLSEREDLENWQGLLPSEVVVLTFTNRAADEMRHRLWTELNRLKSGPSRDDGGIRRDSRVTSDGFIQQLTAMLEDAPIGTIDSFLSRLIGPWRADLSQRPTHEIINEAERNVLLNQALEGLWRLRSPDDAVAAGVSGERAPFVIEARDRLARRFGSRSAVRKVLSSLLSNRIFVDSVARRLEGENGVDAEDVRRLVTQILAPVDADFNSFVSEIHTATLEWVDLVRTHGDKLDVVSAMGMQTRFRTLVELVDIGPPSTRWERWLWLHALCVTTCTISSHKNSSVSAFGRGNLSNSPDWPRGIETWSKVKDPVAKESGKSLGESIKQLWNCTDGKSFRPLARAIYLMDSTTFEVPFMPAVDGLIPDRIESPIGYASTSNNPGFGIEEEALNLQDILICHRSLLDILHELKVRMGVHEFDDVASLAGDLLLARCPRIMRADYPIEVVRALDSLPEEPWRDEHIHTALSHLDQLGEDASASGFAMKDITRWKEDLQKRYSRLQNIRSRYRAFIIDEAQDNSAQQWRLLGRLWGPRYLPEGRTAPDTPWEPTVCCVGDRKQSIYAFRQAQVSGFVAFGRSLRDINQHELYSVEALTRSPELRRPTEARDPRYSADGGFSTLSDLPDSRSTADTAWIRFDEVEKGSTSPVDAIGRSQGHVELVVNYRTAGDLLNRMNDWWEDIFDPSHDRFPGDWYARPQALIPDRSEEEGRLEWLVPAKLPSSGHPEVDLTIPLDPFSSGSTKEMENALIAARIQALITGAETRVGDTKQGTIGPLNPGEILVLLPSRSNLDDLMSRLEAAGIPAVADKEGSLLQRPVIRPLLGLIEWLARPSSRHAAAIVARSCLVGLNDKQLQEFLGGSTVGENLFIRLSSILEDSPHRSLVDRWAIYSESGSIREALDTTLNFSDLLVAHPKPSERNDSETFLQMVEQQLENVGGDPVLLADRLTYLIDVAANAISASSDASSDSVQIMTIHGSKGLQRRCVIVGGLFSESQGNISHDLRDRVIATPSLFASNPRPWLSDRSIDSGIWTFAKTLQEAQIQAEARRLFYVACTRVKDYLIIAGAPNDSFWNGKQVSMKPRSTSMPTFGHMWFQSLGWEPDEESNRYILDPSTVPFPVYHNVSELGEQNSIFSPLVRMSRLHESSMIAFEDVENPEQEEFPTRTRSIRISPHQLDTASICPSCYWSLLKQGISPSNQSFDSSKETLAENVGLPAPNVIGTIFHRLVEIGLANPGVSGNLSAPLPAQWTLQSPDLLSDEKTIDSVLTELLPPDANALSMKGLLKQMAVAIQSGPLGTLTSGKKWAGEEIEGLRTEWPFSLNYGIDLVVDDSMWTPHGPHKLANIEKFVFSSSGIADLILCTRFDDDRGAIRAVDLKTTAAAHLFSGKDHPLLNTTGPERSSAEQELLDHYRMQLALYTHALLQQEKAREKAGITSRVVLPPAILSSVTGRMIVMTEEEMHLALEDLHTLLQNLAKSVLAYDEQENKERSDCQCKFSGIHL